MSIHKLSFRLRRTVPVVLQGEGTECALACLCMIARYHGLETDLSSLRARFHISQKGASLAQLTQIADRLDFTSCAIKAELEELEQLRTPCILHWNFTHFVVLKAAARDHVTIIDPACGERKVPLEETSRSFTGVAIELWPKKPFKSGATADSALPLRKMVGHVSGFARSLAQIAVVALALELFAVITPLYLQWVIDSVIVSANLGLLTTLAIGFTLVLLLRQALTTARSWMLVYMGTTLSLQWNLNLFSHLMRLPISYFERRHLGDITSRFGSIERVQQVLTTSFFESLLDGVMTIVVLLIMFAYSPSLTFISLGALLLYGVSVAFSYPLQMEAARRHVALVSRQQSHFLESVRGVRPLKLFGKERARAATWTAMLIDQINASIRLQLLQMTQSAASGLIVGLQNILITWLGARAVIEGRFTVGFLMAFFAYRFVLESRIVTLMDRLLAVKMLKVHGERLSDIVLSEPEVEPAGENEPALLREEPHGRARPVSVTLQGLVFSYAPTEPRVLDGIDLHVSAGECVAITGPSGCGKSTLVSLLAGILAPTGGRILIDGIEGGLGAVHRLRAVGGVVLQDDKLFAASIADNISFFDPQADPAWIRECARIASIDAEILAMPMGYHSLIGDMGMILSGGQKQRVLLARALYKRPRLLLLDEATSHLDVARETLVNEAVRSLNMTRIIVAHRIETIRSANRCITLAGGRVASDSLNGPVALADELTGATRLRGAH